MTIDIEKLSELIWHSVFANTGCSESTAYDAADSIVTILEPILAEREAMLNGIGDFLAKFEAVKAAIDGAFAFQHIHGVTYEGPTLEVELKALRAVYQAALPKGEDGRG